VPALVNKMFGAAGTPTTLIGIPEGTGGSPRGLAVSPFAARNVSPWVHLITGTILPGCLSTAA